MIHRRGLITGLMSLVAAPAIVRAESLMPVSYTPKEWLLCDGSLINPRHYPDLARLCKTLPKQAIHPFDQILSAVHNVHEQQIHFSLYMRALPHKMIPVGSLYHDVTRNVDFR